MIVPPVLPARLITLELVSLPPVNFSVPAVDVLPMLIVLFVPVLAKLEIESVPPLMFVTPE